MACDGGDRIGSLVDRIAAPWAAKSRLLLLHRKQRSVGRVGMAGASVGVDCAADRAVSHEPQGMEKEHSGAG